jgi:hypothetical protein
MIATKEESKLKVLGCSGFFALMLRKSVSFVAGPAMSGNEQI